MTERKANMRAGAAILKPPLLGLIIAPAAIMALLLR